MNETLVPATSGNMSPEVEHLVSGQSGGEPLAPAIQARLETALEIPLDLVRVHRDARTRKVVDGTGARAFTYGLHIYLGSHASAADVELMAHEITHVVQQQGRPVLQMYTESAAGDGFEHEAAHVAGAVQRGQRATVSRRTGGARVQTFWPVSQIAGWLERRAWGLVRRYAPTLVDIIHKGPLEWIKEKIVRAVNSIVDTLMAPVRAITGLAASLRKHFANLLAWLRDAAAKIARGDCSSLTQAAHKIHEVFVGIASPIIDRIKHFAKRVKDFFGDLWDRFGAPVWKFLRRVGGAVWDAIASFGRWIWNITAPIRRILARAWRWIKNKLGIGEGAEGQNGLLQWVQRKAQSAWDNYILPFILRFKRPLMVVGGILIMLSPAGPIIAIGAVAVGVTRGVRAIRHYFGTRGGIVHGRNVLQRQIIPGIVRTINRVAAFLRQKALFLAGTLNRIVGGLGNAAGAVAGTIIGFIARGLIWLARRFGELANWVVGHLMAFVNWVGGVLQRLAHFLRPVLDFLRRVAAVVRNTLRIGYEFGARIWNAIPACIRDPFIDFFIPLILRQIPFFRELGATPEAWRQTRASIMLLVRQIFRDFDLWGAMRTAFGIVVRALRIPIDLVQQLLQKAARAWNAVVDAPIRFIRSALQAILLGVGGFMRRFLSHLWHGVQGWLFNAVSDRGITPPSSWTDLRAVFGFVLDVLGISLDHVLELLATRIGQPAVARIRTMLRVLTGVWEWVSVAIREGPAGIWRMLVDRLSNLGRMVLESAVQWVMGRIIAIVGARLAALAASSGLSGIIEGVVAVYQAVQTAIEYARRILQVLITVFDTVNQLAHGNINPAARGVERGLDMAMPVVIGFLANYAGLGGIGDRIREIIDGVRARVDAAILWLIDHALAAGRWILDRLRAGVAAVVDWWRARQPFRSANRRDHTLLFHGEAGSAVLYTHTVQRPLTEYVRLLRGRPDAAAHQQTFANIDRIQDEIQTLRTRTVRHTGGRVEERLDQPTQESGPLIAGKLRELADQLATLPDPDGASGESLVMPPSRIVTRTPHVTSDPRASLSGASTDGEVVEIKPLSIRPGSGLAGSLASAHSPLYRAVTQRAGTYVAGHLLGAHVYGPGNEFWNLTPITESANRSMSSRVEDRIHQLIFEENKVVHYTIRAHYPGSPTPGPVIPAEGFLPTQLTFVVETMRLKPSVETAAAGGPGGLDAARIVPDNWEDETNIPFAPVSSTPPLTTPISQTSADRILDFITANAEATPEGRRVPTFAVLVQHLGLGRTTIVTALQELVGRHVLRQATNGRYYFRV